MDKLILLLPTIVSLVSGICTILVLSKLGQFFRTHSKKTIEITIKGITKKIKISNSGLNIADEISKVLEVWEGESHHDSSNQIDEK